MKKQAQLQYKKTNSTILNDALNVGYISVHYILDSFKECVFQA